MFRSIAFYVALAGIVAAILLVRKQNVEPPTPPPVAEPAKAPFRISIGGKGIVESAFENVRIAPPNSGFVTKVYVEVGDKVSTGTPLFLVDDRTAQADVKVQETQVAVLEGRLREAQALLADRRDQTSRTETLTERDVASVEEAVRAQFALQQAEATVLRTFAELESARAQLLRSKVALETLTVRAPRAGTILQVNVRPGEYANLFANTEPLMLLGQTDVLQLRTDVDEENASRVRPGAPAVAYIKGSREEPIELEFIRIEPYVVPKRSLTGLSTERVDTRVLQIIYRFRRSSVPIYVGQQMDVFINGSMGGEEVTTPTMTTTGSEILQGN